MDSGSWLLSQSGILLLAGRATRNPSPGRKSYQDILVALPNDLKTRGVYPPLTISHILTLQNIIILPKTEERSERYSVNIHKILTSKKQRMDRAWVVSRMLNDTKFELEVCRIMNITIVEVASFEYDKRTARCRPQS